MAQATPKLRKVKQPQPQPRAATPEEGRALFEEDARRLLGMSGEEFVRAWEAGEFDADPDRLGVQEVAMMLPAYYGYERLKRP